MGTRHLQVVISKEGKKVISQYGQWDGYPSGQGREILDFLKHSDQEAYKQNLENIREATPQEIDRINKWGDDWPDFFPYMSRDCGARIHRLIEFGYVPFVKLTSQEEADKWCEGFYTIDFQKGVFISEFGGVTATFNLNDLPTDEEYLTAMKDE